MAEATIEAYYLEDRTFPPPDEFRRNALVSDDSLYKEADADWRPFLDLHHGPHFLRRVSLGASCRSETRSRRSRGLPARCRPRAGGCVPQRS